MSDGLGNQIKEILELQERLANFNGVGHGAGAARNRLSDEFKEKLQVLEDTLVNTNPETIAQFQNELSHINFDEETKALLENGTLTQTRNQENIQALITEVTETQAKLENPGDARALPYLQSELAEKIGALESALASVDDQTLITLREQLESLPLSENGQEMLVGRFDNISLAQAREQRITAETQNMPQLEVTDDNVQTVSSSSTPNSLSALEGKTLFKGVGNYDNSVTILQEILKALGLDLGRFGVDGHFGSATETAVRSFQEQQGLSQDGIVGPQTLGKLREAMAQNQAQNVTTTTQIEQPQETTVVETPNPSAINPSLLNIPENQLTMT